MLAKPKPSHPLNGMHTAGIFSDASIDGAEIGTLVLVVDRAKNLPNRKTIGKQDPYCAARLGKEAKKTTTDIRGGQTPKWDQELRFTVRDCPDYEQLKISVFNDDKKTDLIGENWIDLRDIIVSGGGQSDQWHTLNCRGKYAGEIRIEITYYDSRPKPERPVAKPKPVSTDDNGSMARRDPLKRRPLPTDPVTGEVPSQPAPEATATPPRPAKQPVAYIPNQSPLQAFEYNTPPPPRHQSSHDHYSPSPQPLPSYPSPSPSRQDVPPPKPQHWQQPQQPPRHERYDSYSGRYEERDFSPNHPPAQHTNRRGSYNPPPEQYDLPQLDETRHYGYDDQRHFVHQADDVPPPPPAHGRRNNSGPLDAAYRHSMDVVPQKGPPMPMRHDVLRNAAHRMSMPAQPGRPPLREVDSAPPAPVYSGNHHPEGHYHQPSPPRHHSYDNSYEVQHRAMQPSVEEVPDSSSPVVPYPYRRSSSRPPQYDDLALDDNPTPAPLNLSGRNSAASGTYANSPAPPPRMQDSHGHSAPVSPLHHRDYMASPTELSAESHHSFGRHTERNEWDDNSYHHTSPNYGLPALPSSLVPGMDPALSMEISERIYEERRHDRRNASHNAHSNPTPPRGRQRSEPLAGYGPGSSPHAYAPDTYQPRESRGGVTYSSAPSPPVVRPRPISPNPNPAHTIRRKSVSPAPPPQENRRLSGVPFGPDSYDALNPSVASSKDSAKPDYSDPNSKIITHDGREIDPSDHLPMESWAPEPEPKPTKLPDLEARGGRPAPAGAQPMPPSGGAGRRQIRISGRPQSMMPQPTTYMDGTESRTPPAPTGRNRLQKKAHRQSTMPLPASSSPAPAGSSPLAPISSHNYQDHHHAGHNPAGSGFTPPRMSRASTWDYPNENHAPQYGSSPGGGGAGGFSNGSPAARGRGAVPPVPAKVPLPSMSGALVPARGGPGGWSGGNSGGGDERSLAEEMGRIDIGSGRSRRHGGYNFS